MRKISMSGGMHDMGGVGPMNKIAMGLVLLLAVVLIVFGSIFVIAGEIGNTVTGLILIVIGLVLVYYVYRADKVKASQPQVVQQTVNVQMGGSGQLNQKAMTCKNCGGPLSDKDLKLVEGAVMVTCPYCGTVSSFEEAPKW
jgi:cell division protein FtsB